MFKTIVIAIMLLLTTIYAYAEIEIYCPKCREHLYNYQQDKITAGFPIYAKDFKPVKTDIKQPIDNDPMTCPLCQAKLNGWDFYGEYNNSKSHVNTCNAISLLTKVDNKFKWIPYHVPDTGVAE